jgi:putative SOS response-associated peptidase YedK
MCGRYTLTVRPEEVWEELELAGEPPADSPARYNIAPTQDVPIVTSREPSALRFVRWGLVPFWATDPSIGSKMINARAESLVTKNAFKASFQDRRCLVVADGFYEWRTNDNGSKTPMYIQLPGGRPFVFAGLWSAWKSAAGDRLETCAIITTDSAEALAGIHDRMPVILPAELRRAWLDESASPAVLLGLLGPYRGELSVRPVSTLVNSVKNDSPALIEAVDDRPRQFSLFDPR